MNDLTVIQDGGKKPKKKTKKARKWLSKNVRKGRKHWLLPVEHYRSRAVSFIWLPQSCGIWDWFLNCVENILTQNIKLEQSGWLIDVFLKYQHTITILNWEKDQQFV